MSSGRRASGRARLTGPTRRNQDAPEALVAHIKQRGYRHPTSAGSLQTGDFRAAKRRSAFYPETDVVLFASDVFAADAVLEALRQGIDVPGDIAITGFGDTELARHLVPTLTTVSIPNREIGTVAGHLLLDRMSKTTSEPSQIDLGFSIVARESA